MLAAIRDLNKRVIQELPLADLTKTQYTRDDEEPYSPIDYELYCNSNEFPSLLFY